MIYDLNCVLCEASSIHSFGLRRRLAVLLLNAFAPPIVEGIAEDDLTRSEEMRMKSASVDGGGTI